MFRSRSVSSASNRLLGALLDTKQHPSIHREPNRLDEGRSEGQAGGDVIGCIHAIAADEAARSARLDEGEPGPLDPTLAGRTRALVDRTLLDAQWPCVARLPRTTSQPSIFCTIKPTSESFDLGFKGRGTGDRVALASAGAC